MRKELENRRPAFAFNIIDANGTPYRLTTSFQNEDVKEVWINGGGKVGTERHDILTEIGRIISVALQNDVAFEELKSCATYHSDGRPATIIGELFDAIDFKG
mgnify:FL=1|jgi:hypothetical protein|tara:strand:+ start:138 stop:443 length:306 start_codon:yes stop_codon:yes gene_type:complete